MNCKCFEEINLKLRKATKDPEARLCVMIALSGNKMEALPYVQYTYRPIKQDGTFAKQKEGNLALSKCPFCGKPVKEEESPGPGKTS